MTRGGALWEGRRRAEEIQLRIRYTPEPPSQDDDMPFLIWPLIVRIYIYEEKVIAAVTREAPRLGRAQVGGVGARRDESNE